MKKNIVAILTAALVGAGALFGAIPADAKEMDYRTEIDFYRGIARSVLHDGRYYYDDYSIGVLMDSDGDCVQLPEYCNGNMYYFRYKGKGKRGNVVMCSYLYDKDGEVSDVNYFLLDDGEFNRTAEIENDYFRENGEMPLYAYYRR